MTVRSDFLVIGASLAVITLAPAQIAHAKGRPHIRARPASIAAGQRTTLAGSGFAPETKLKLEECAQTGWILPPYPCVNKPMTVRTNSEGNFTASFEVRSCPYPSGRAGVTPRARSHTQRCYVGELETGEDGGALLGAAKLTVSY